MPRGNKNAPAQQLATPGQTADNPAGDALRARASVIVRSQSGVYPHGRSRHPWRVALRRVQTSTSTFVLGMTLWRVS